jgi:alkylation response protein AidB-like acyl-CoA dehydrogenase
MIAATDRRTDVPGATELVARVRELQPLIRQHAAQGEQDRRVAEQSIKALLDAGILKIAQPRRYGGYETSMRTMLDVSAAVGEADGGTAWVVTLLNVCAWMTGLYPQQAQDEVWGADPDALVCGVLAPTAETRKVEGGYQVTGRWFYTSGSWHASWAVLGIPVTDENGEVVDQGLALIPRSELEYEETWFVAGMKSTGSNCLIAKDVFVPGHRIVSVPPAIEGTYATEFTDEALYRAAFVPILALVLAGPQLGMGRADSVAFQLQLAAARGVYPGFVTRARVRADTGWAVDHVLKAINILLSAHGAASFAEVSPLQRIWRDSAVAARHAVVLPVVGYEVYGKALLGREDHITPLV